MLKLGLAKASRAFSGQILDAILAVAGTEAMKEMLVLCSN
jgi:hypothetical protein